MSEARNSGNYKHWWRRTAPSTAWLPLFNLSSPSPVVPSPFIPVFFCVESSNLIESFAHFVRQRDRERASSSVKSLHLEPSSGETEWIVGRKDYCRTTIPCRPYISATGHVHVQLNLMYLSLALLLCGHLKWFRITPSFTMWNGLDLVVRVTLRPVWWDYESNCGFWRIELRVRTSNFLDPKAWTWDITKT